MRLENVLIVRIAVDGDILVDLIGETEDSPTYGPSWMTIKNPRSVQYTIPKDKDKEAAESRTPTITVRLWNPPYAEQDHLVVSRNQVVSIFKPVKDLLKSYAEAFTGLTLPDTQLIK